MSYTFLFISWYYKIFVIIWESHLYLYTKQHPLFQPIKSVFRPHHGLNIYAFKYLLWLFVLYNLLEILYKWSHILWWLKFKKQMCLKKFIDLIYWHHKTFLHNFVVWSFFLLCCWQTKLLCNIWCLINSLYISANWVNIRTMFYHFFYLYLM